MVALQLKRILKETNYLELFSEVLYSDMGPKWHWSLSWTVSGGSKMEVVHTSLLFLTSWWLSIPSTIVSFGADLGSWRWVTQFCVGSPPSLRDQSESVLMESESPVLGPCFMRCRQGSVLPASFNIYMKLLDKIIHHCGDKYHQYTDDTQL